MEKPIVKLPYFDVVLEKFRQGDPEMLELFGRHLHYGYWDDPGLADGSEADFVRAAENLCQRIFSVAKVQDGLRILDVGCGFGGTLASINERFDRVELVGLNIDRRQLERAKQQVQARSSNSIEFVEGNACALPFADGSFDVVLAVECIFHFPSRLQFMQEARRVLRPGGRLALTDFVPAKMLLPLLLPLDGFFDRFVTPTFGHWDMKCTQTGYRKLAQSAGLTSIYEEDFTVKGLPSVEIFYHRLVHSEMSEYLGSRSLFQIFYGLQRLRLLRLMLLGYQA